MTCASHRPPAARVPWLGSLGKGIGSLPRLGLLAFIRAYQRTLSPLLPAVFGPACGCRFYPSCSRYAAEAVTAHGAWRGAWLAAIRLLKCTPLHAGGFDPVPAIGRATPPAQRTPSRTPVCSRSLRA